MDVQRGSVRKLVRTAHRAKPCNRVCVNCLRRSIVGWSLNDSHKAARRDAARMRKGWTMKSYAKLAIALLVLVGALEFLDVASALARGGAANIMNSPGYQRRLQESRQQYSQSYGQAPVIHSRKNWHHRHHRY
jgi:hypothetical protein